MWSRTSPSRTAKTALCSMCWTRIKSQYAQMGTSKLTRSALFSMSTGALWCFAFNILCSHTWHHATRVFHYNTSTSKMARSALFSMSGTVPSGLASTVMCRTSLLTIMHLAPYPFMTRVSTPASHMGWLTSAPTTQSAPALQPDAIHKQVSWVSCSMTADQLGRTAIVAAVDPCARSPRQHHTKADWPLHQPLNLPQPCKQMPVLVARPHEQTKSDTKSLLLLLIHNQGLYNSITCRLLNLCSDCPIVPSSAHIMQAFSCCSEPGVTVCCSFVKWQKESILRHSGRDRMAWRGRGTATAISAAFQHYIKL